jgi:hypothetical protein
MKEIVDAHDEGRLIEAFGCGTAAVVSPIQAIGYNGKVRTHTRHDRTQRTNAQHATTYPHEAKGLLMVAVYGRKSRSLLGTAGRRAT